MFGSQTREIDTPLRFISVLTVGLLVIPTVTL